MAKKACFIFLASSLSFGFTKAQEFSMDMWHEGRVILMLEDTIPGSLQYDLDNDLIQIAGEGVIKTYSSRKILCFEFVDALTESFRVFYALPYRVRPNYKAPVIFEIVCEGRLTLLSREHLVVEANTTYDIYNNPVYLGTTTKLAYDYYFLYQTGEIVPYYKKKKLLWKEIFRDYGSEMKQYIKENKLKSDRKADIVKMVIHYNSLWAKSD